MFLPRVASLLVSHLNWQLSSLGSVSCCYACLLCFLSLQVVVMGWGLLALVFLFLAGCRHFIQLGHWILHVFHAMHAHPSKPISQLIGPSFLLAWWYVSGLCHRPACDKLLGALSKVPGPPRPLSGAIAPPDRTPASL
jgi:hypothetical protein